MQTIKRLQEINLKSDKFYHGNKFNIIKNLRLYKNNHDNTNNLKLIILYFFSCLCH